MDDRQRRIELHALRIQSHPGWDQPDPDEDDHPIPLEVREEAARDLARWLGLEDD